MTCCALHVAEVQISLTILSAAFEKVCPLHGSLSPTTGAACASVLLALPVLVLAPSGRSSAALSISEATKRTRRTTSDNTLTHSSSIARWAPPKPCDPSAASTSVHSVLLSNFQRALSRTLRASFSSSFCSPLGAGAGWGSSPINPTMARSLTDLAILLKSRPRSWTLSACPTLRPAPVGSESLAGEACDGVLYWSRARTRSNDEYGLRRRVSSTVRKGSKSKPSVVDPVLGVPSFSLPTDRGRGPSCPEDFMVLHPPNSSPSHVR
mmetsp:Transcript_20969/g.45734  ORF Transcript_20969/g.45734 Transcript_20969/m.45734 type:complete len:266 (+) Transcript_20969:178-975(+)